MNYIANVHLPSKQIQFLKQYVKVRARVLMFLV